MSAYIERINGRYQIGTAYGKYFRSSLAQAAAFCRSNGFKPVYVGVL